MPPDPCPLGRSALQTCARKQHGQPWPACMGCRDAYYERVAILRFGALKPGTTEPLAATLADAEAMARAQLSAAEK